MKNDCQQAADSRHGRLIPSTAPSPQLPDLSATQELQIPRFARDDRRAISDKPSTISAIIAYICASAERRPRRPTFRLDAQVFESRHSKGDLAEIAFLAKAISLGFTVCKPFSGNARFDFILTGGGMRKRAKRLVRRRNNGGASQAARPDPSLAKQRLAQDDRQSRVWKVQVKSSWEPLRGRRYQIRVGSGVNGRPRRYRADEVDFIVAYIVREDVWYVIPIGEIHTAHCIGVFPHDRKSRGRFEKYREAWELLK